MTFNPDHGADFHESDYYRERESSDDIAAMLLASIEPARLNPDVPRCADGQHRWVHVRFCGGEHGCGLVEGLETP